MSIKVQLHLVSFLLPNGHSIASFSSAVEWDINVKIDTLTNRQTDIVIHKHKLFSS